MEIARRNTNNLIAQILLHTTRPFRDFHYPLDLELLTIHQRDREERTRHIRPS
jgi:hypothetical protein